MTLTIPRTDVLTAAIFTDQAGFNLVSRQEISRQANGIPRGKDFGSAIWVTGYTTAPTALADAVDYEAVLNSLDGVINGFYAYDLRRPYPGAYPTGSFTDSGQINSLNGNNKAMTIKSLPVGFVLSRGDYLAFDYGSGPSRALHQVMETVTANGAGLTPEFEVRPHIRAGAAVNAAVTLKKPSALFVMDVGSMQSGMQGSLHSAVSFKAIQRI